METIQNIEQLQIPAPVQKDLSEFLNQIIQLYANDLVSIMAFGSSVTKDYMEDNSDINLLIVYSDLNITDLNTVAKLARGWLKKRAFSPRFISMKNLNNSSAFFQIDMLEMKDMHITLYGKDLLNSINISKAGLHWQLSYEIKAMRMRIKQQFWRSCGDDHVMRKILLERFTSIIHLSRVLLFLMDKAVPQNFEAILQTAKNELGLSSTFLDSMLALKNKTIKPSNVELVELFTGLMDTIRTIDDKTDQVKV
jgi:predicted nucleotidyltransferase